MDASIYGPIRLVGSLLAIGIYVGILMALAPRSKGVRVDAAVMREFTMAFLLLLTGIGFFIGAVALLNTDVTPIVRFVNTAILGGIIVGGIHILATLRTSRM